MLMMPIAYHGLAAYSASRHSPLRMYRNGLAAQQISGTADLCIADRPIGPMGLIVSGQLSSVYDRDVWSEQNCDGSRIATRQCCWSGLLNVSTHAEWASWSIAHAGTARYCEGWMRDPIIHGVWVKPHATRSQLAAADSLCRRFGFASAKIVTRDQLISDLYATEDEEPANDDLFDLWDRLAR